MDLMLLLDLKCMPKQNMTYSIELEKQSYFEVETYRDRESRVWWHTHIISARKVRTQQVQGQPGHKMKVCFPKPNCEPNNKTHSMGQQHQAPIWERYLGTKVAPTLHVRAGKSKCIHSDLCPTAFPIKENKFLHMRKEGTRYVNPHPACWLTRTGGTCAKRGWLQKAAGYFQSPHYLSWKTLVQRFANQMAFN